MPATVTVKNVSAHVGQWPVDSHELSPVQSVSVLFGKRGLSFYRSLLHPSGVCLAIVGK
jgi:hypothetical protein